MAKWDLTWAALEEFNDTRGVRQALWDTVQDEVDVGRAEFADAEALQRVQEAFYRETKDINSWHNCQLLSAEDIRRMIGRAHAAGAEPRT
jgi:protein-disulfide isomerase-like protein with CxxC motif